jgi:hypothetical protein
MFGNGRNESSDFSRIVHARDPVHKPSPHRTCPQPEVNIKDSELHKGITP